MLHRSDFNIVVIEEGRTGISASVKRRDMVDFNNFMENMDLIDLPCMGNRCTWFSGSGTSMSRLDSILLTKMLVMGWKLDNQFVRKTVIFQFCLKVEVRNGDPNPLDLITIGSSMMIFPVLWKNSGARGRSRGEETSVCMKR